MLTIASLKSSTGKDKPYNSIIRMKAVKKSANLEGRKPEVAVADQTGASKVITQTDTQSQKFVVGQTYIVRNFVLGRRYILLNKSSIITKCTQMTVPPEYEEEAKLLVDPPPPPVSSVHDIVDAGVTGEIVSIEGMIVADETPHDVTVSGRPTQVRNMTIKDQTGVIGVALWQHKAQSPAKPGDQVKITSLKPRKDNYTKKLQLASTGFTEIQVQEVVTKFHFATFLAVEEVKDQTYTLAAIVDQDYRIIKADKDVVQAMFNTCTEEDLLSKFNSLGEIDVFLKGDQLQKPIAPTPGI